MKLVRLNFKRILFQCGLLFSVFSSSISFAQNIPEVPFVGDDPCVANVEQVFSDLQTQAKLQKVNSSRMFETENTLFFQVRIIGLEKRASLSHELRSSVRWKNLFPHVSKYGARSSDLKWKRPCHLFSL